MERLTRKSDSGMVWFIDREHKSGYVEREPYEMDAHHSRLAIAKLAEYEDLEEQGKLLNLPCAVGDRIFRIDTDEKIENTDIEIYYIDNIVILADGRILLKYDAYDGVICELENIITDKPYLDFYRCFLLQEEAEAALKELED